MTELEPVLRVVRGTPTVEEIAALVGVLLGRARPVAAAPAAPVSRWRLSARPGPAHRPGPGAWRASALPPR